MIDDQHDETLDAGTQQTLDMINNVYDHNVDEIEREVGRVLFRNVGRLIEQLRPLPQRQRIAAVYVVLTKVSASLIDVGVACEHLAKRPRD